MTVSAPPPTGPADAADAPDARDARDAAENADPRLRYRFGLLLAGQTVSAFGDAFAVVAMPLLVLSLTGSVAQMGLVGGTALVTQLAAGPFIGPLVDRLDRRRLMIVCDLAQGVLAGLIPVTWWLLRPGSGAGLAVIYVVVVLGSVAATCFRITHRAVLPRLVGRHRLMSANARLTTATEIAYGLGPAAAGLVVAAAGEATAIGINALSFFVSAAALIALRMPAPGPDADPGPPARGARSTAADWRAGLRLLLGNPLLRALTVADLVNSLLAAGVATLFIYYLRHDLASSSVEIGLILSLTSVGAVIGAFAAAPARRRFGFGRAWLGGVALSGAALLAVGFSADVRMVAVLAIVFAVGNVGAIILSSSVRQELTPDPLLGRVTAAVVTMTLAAEAVGSVTATTAADVAAVTAVFVVLGALHVPLVVGAAFTTLGAGRDRQPIPGQPPAPPSGDGTAAPSDGIPAHPPGGSPATPSGAAPAEAVRK